jgi:hypothetical protein
MERLVGQLLLEFPTLGNLPSQPCVCLGEPRGPLPYALVELGVCAAYLLLGPLALGHVVLHPDEVDEPPPFVVHRGEPQFVPEQGAVLAVIAQENLAIAPFSEGGAYLW